MAAGLKVGDILAGRYPIQGIIGEGGMGAVYRAGDLSSQRTWAIKEMTDSFDNAEERAEAAAAFDIESKLLSQLEHPNLPRITHCFSEKGRQYLVMDLVEGQNLQKILETRSGHLSVAQSLEIALQIADVLDYLHTRPVPVIFRDLKPANIMVTPKNVVKLIDFGIARFFRSGKNADTRAMGTPGYAAPEQYGRGQSDARTDIYALGATLHQCLTGHDPSLTPFKFAPPSQLAQVPQALDAIVLKAVDIEQSKRWSNIKEFRQALEKLRDLPEMYDKLPDKLRTGVLPPPEVKVFDNRTIDFGQWAPGQELKTQVIMHGAVHGTVKTSKPWLKTVPAYASGTDVPLNILVDTNKISSAGHHFGEVAYGQNSIVIEVDIIKESLGCWAVPLAVALMICSILPFLGIIPALSIILLIFWTPAEKRQPFWVLLSIAVFFAIMSSLIAYGSGTWLYPYLQEFVLSNF